jgi:GNAT superfamily N-acetyltransferase
VWGERDPILGRVKGRVQRALPSAELTTTQAGHFLQEEVPVEIASAVRRVAEKIAADADGVGPPSAREGRASPDQGPVRLDPAFIREAAPEEAEALSALAFRSKAHWGYSAEFMERARKDLEIDRAYIAAHPTFVMDSGRGEAVGMAALVDQGADWRLDALWVDPPHIGRGHGGRLFRHAEAYARSEGARSLVIHSDPNALGFHLAMGAQLEGEIESRIEPGRMLPVLRKS